MVNGNADSGLQAERTGLAWQRTALAAGALALFLLYHAAYGGGVLLAVPAALTGLSAVSLAVAGARRERALRRPPTPVPASAAALTAACVTGAAATTLMVVLR